MVSKRRSDMAALLEGARTVVDEVVAAPEDERAARMTAGLRELWPAPLHACLLEAPNGGQISTLDEAGHPQADWANTLRGELARAGENGRLGSRPVPPEVGLAEHTLHQATARRGERCYGTLAVALHRRASDVGLAQTLLTYAADHLAFALAERELRRQAQAQMRDMADFAALVAHEFNNALNTIGLQAAVLAHKGITPEDHPELAEVRRAVRFAGGRVRQMQEFCRAGRGSLAPTELNQAVCQAAQGIPGVQLELAPDLPPVLATDMDLERLVAILLRNAQAAGAQTIVVRTGQGDAGVWLRVEDDGALPDDEMMPQLFEPFAPVRPSIEGGGPALARAVARRLEAQVSGEKRPSGGMAFVVSLRRPYS